MIPPEPITTDEEALGVALVLLHYLQHREREELAATKGYAALDHKYAAKQMHKVAHALSGLARYDRRPKETA